jgi:hypothetical protein
MIRHNVIGMWSAVSAATLPLARAIQPPAPIDPLSDNPVVRSPSCGHTQQYLGSECFLARVGAKAAPDRAVGALIIGARLIAAVRLSRAESAEIQKRSPRVYGAIANALAIAKMVAEQAASTDCRESAALTFASGGQLISQLGRSNRLATRSVTEPAAP